MQTSILDTKVGLISFPSVRQSLTHFFQGLTIGLTGWMYRYIIQDWDENTVKFLEICIVAFQNCWPREIANLTRLAEDNLCFRKTDKTPRVHYVWVQNWPKEDGLDSWGKSNLRVITNKMMYCFELDIWVSFCSINPTKQIELKYIIFYSHIDYCLSYLSNIPEVKRKQSTFVSIATKINSSLYVGVGLICYN